MNVTVATTPESEAQFQVQLAWNEIDRAAERVYKRLAQKHTVPGFRPGHAPRTLIERLVGRDALYEEAIDDLVEDAVRAKAKESALTLLMLPHAHVHEINYGEEHAVTVTVPVLAKGELSDYHDIHIEVIPEPVTEEDIDKVIDRYRESKAVYVPVERPAALGDRVTVDLQLTINEKSISNLKDHEFDLVEERTGLFTGMDQEIAGMSEGESKDFTTTLPADYPKEEYAGQTATYAVTLQKVAVKTPPELDDALANEAGKFETVAAMRDSIRADLAKSRATTAERDTRDKVIEALLEHLELTVPAVLVDAEVEDVIRELNDLLSSQQMDFNSYMAMTGNNIDAFRESTRPEALRRIRQRRAMELVAEREGIVATDHDVQDLLNLYASSGGRGRTRVQQLNPTQRSNIAHSIERDRALEWLIANQTVQVAAPTDATPLIESAATADDVEAKAQE